MSDAKRGCGRPRAKPLPTGVTAEQIEAIAELTGMSEATRQAAKLVLADALTSSLASLETGLSPQSINHALMRCARALELAKIAAGVAAEAANPPQQGVL